MRLNKIWKSARVLIAVGLFCFSGLTSHSLVQAQQDTNELYTTDVNGTKMENGAALITGQVRNPFPWDAVNVEIAVFFNDDPTLYKTTTVDEVPAGGQASFTIAEENAQTLNTFVSVVTQYGLMSDDVDALLKLYSERDSIVLQDAIQRSFPLMTEQALPRLLACIDVSARSDVPDLQQSMKDLVCLGGIQALAKDESVGPLLQLLSWYEVHQMVDLPLIKEAMVSDQYHLAWFLPILKNVEPLFVTIDQLITPILVNIGPAGVPELVEGQSKSTPLAQETIQIALDSIDGSLIQSLNESQDVQTLVDVIDAIGALKKGEAVQTMLDKAQQNVDLVDTVNSSIRSIGPAAFPGLLKSLANPKQPVADQAQQLMSLLATSYQDQFLEAVRAENGNVPPGDVESVLEQIRDTADQQVQQEIDKRFSDTWYNFNNTGCDAGYNSLQEMKDYFAGRAIFVGKETEVAQIYACKARLLAEQNDLAAALSLGELALRLDPRQADLVDEMNNWSILQIEASILSKNWDEARSQLQTYQQNHPESTVVNQLQQKLFYTRYKWPLILATIAVIAGLARAFSVLNRKRSFSRLFKKALEVGDRSAIESFNNVYIQWDTQSRQAFLRGQFTAATIKSYVRISEYSNTELGKDALSILVDTSSRAKIDGLVDALADIVIKLVTPGWKLALEKLIKLDVNRAWDCCKKLLFTESNAEPTLLFLNKANTRTFADSIDELAREAINYPMQLRAGLTQLLQISMQHNDRQEIEKVLMVCLDLSVPDTKALYTLDTKEGLAAWRNILSTTDGTATQRWETQLGSPSAHFHKEALATALKIAKPDTAKRNSDSESKGAERMQQILIRAMLTVRSDIADKIGKELLSFCRQETIVATLVRELQEADLQRLALWIESNAEVKPLAIQVFRGAFENSSLRQNCLGLLLKIFHKGSEVASTDSFHLLMSQGAILTNGEIEWVACYGKSHHAKLLLHNDDDNVHRTVAAALLGAFRTNKIARDRLAIVYDWIMQYSSKNSINQAVTALLVLSVLDSEKVLQQWKKTPDLWPIAAVQLAMSQPNSPLPGLVQKWCGAHSQEIAIHGVQLLSKLVEG